MLAPRSLALAAVAMGLSLLPANLQAKDTSASIQLRMSDASTGAALRGQARLSPSGARVRMSASGSSLFEGLAAGSYTIQCTHPGYAPQRTRVKVAKGQRALAHCRMRSTAKGNAKKEDKPRDRIRAAEEAAPSRAPKVRMKRVMVGGRGSGMRRPSPMPSPQPIIIADGNRPEHERENYKHIDENPFHDPRSTPLSTFSIDVDTASYSNMRRFLNDSRMPPKDAVKIEELINYFSYSDPKATGETPFSVHTELSNSPWNDSHKLLRIGIKGKEVATDKMPLSNLVFLLDVSGSMNSPNKLPLLKAAFRLLVNNLRPRDRVAIVVYAGAAGVVLPSTPGSRKADILKAIDALEAGGSTAGGAGIELAYKIAQQNFIKGGNNRVILATDGDFNVGTSSEGDLVRLIEKKRKTGTFLTVLGFGSGNYQDAKMEQLADKGNGNHAYIDSILEAKKVLVSEMGGTLLTIAKDVKLQLEFNPSAVKAYRLIGYENRKLAARDFNDDKKDAGELGAGHSITALYEIIPAGSKEKIAGIDELKYQKLSPTAAALGDELLTLKLRYKAPNGKKSKLIQRTVENQLNKTPSQDFRFAAAVAEFGMLLRDSEHKGNASYAHVIKATRASMGKDPEGYRSEFLGLVKKAQLLAK